VCVLSSCTANQATISGTYPYVDRPYNATWIRGYGLGKDGKGGKYGTTSTLSQTGSDPHHSRLKIRSIVELGLGSYRPFKDPPLRIGSPPLPKSFFFHGTVIQNATF
jgi:hypothetical protein